MKLLIFSQNDESGPSSRIRVYQLLEYLKSENIEHKTIPLITKDSMKIFSVLAGGRNPLNLGLALVKILMLYFRRYIDVLSAKNYDAVLVQKDVLPFGLLFLLRLSKKPIIFEYDDPIWLPHSSAGVGKILIPLLTRYRKYCLDRVLSTSAGVITDTPPLLNYAEKFCSKTLLLTSPIVAERYKMNREEEDERACLIWIGSPSNSYLLENLLPSLENFAKNYGSCRLLNVGGFVLHSEIIQIENISWSLDNEVKSLKRAWVGLMPLSPDKFNNYRVGYKIWQYYAASLPVLGVDLGLNRIAIQKGVTGLLYNHSNQEDFSQQLVSMVTEKSYRHAMGKQGRKIVEQENDTDVLGPKWAKFIRGLVEDSRSENARLPEILEPHTLEN
jgi:glycosyltransferase involved in cell wall biosynthesis